MARNPRYLSRWQVAAVITAVVLVLPASAAFDWLEANRPRVALAVFVAGYACFIGLIGFLAWNAWRMVLSSYRLRSGSTARSLRSRLGAVSREPWALYFAALLSIGTIGAVIHLVREIIRRAA